MRIRSGLLAIVVLAALLPKSAESAPIIVTDRTLFKSVIGSYEIETFDGDPVWTFNYYFDVCTGISMTS